MTSTEEHVAPPVVLCDLDGVVWRGAVAVPGAAAGIAVLRAHGVRVGFVTNNSGSTVEQHVARLTAAGVDAVAADIVSSAMAAAALLASEQPRASTVLACAGEGVVESLTQHGFRIVDGAPADAVVVGWHRDFDFDRLAVAADVVRAGARFVATNLDPTYPVPGGLLPGNGAIVAAVATAAGRTPVVAGKPEAPTVALVRERFGTVGVVVGDRPSTDGALAEALGWPFALVLSGVAGTAGEESVPDPPPRFVAADLGVLAPELLRAFG